MRRLIGLFRWLRLWRCMARGIGYRAAYPHVKGIDVSPLTEEEEAWVAGVADREVA